MVADESVKSGRVNRLALVLLTTVATVVGLAPAVLILGRPQLLLYFAAGAAVVAALSLRDFESYATELPSVPEFLLGGLAAVFTPSLLGALWLIAYGLIYAATKLVGSVAVWLGMQVHLNADLIAFYPTVILLAIPIGAVLASQEAEDIASQLYPGTAGIKSAFFELLTQGRRQLIPWTAVALLVLGVALAVFMATGSIGTWFYIFLQSYLFVVSFPLLLLGEETTLPSEATDAVEAIGKLFEATGYDVERFPRTGQADIDPLLISVDLFARKSGHNVFVDVQMATESTRSVDWRTASGLTTATWVLSEQMDLSPKDVDALLVLVDLQAEKSLDTLSKQEGMKVVPITSEDVRRVLEEEMSVEERQEAAWRLLGV